MAFRFIPAILYLNQLRDDKGKSIEVSFSAFSPHIVNRHIGFCSKTILEEENIVNLEQKTVKYVLNDWLLSRNPSTFGVHLQALV